MNKFLCFIELHNWRCTTRSISITGLHKVYLNVLYVIRKRKF